jgi:rhamnose transport system ATP-binding protein
MAAAVPQPEVVRPALEVRGLSKTFGGTLALDHVDFQMQPGEVHAIVGENGAGKSTLIKTLGGVHQPDAGEILIDGQATHISSPVVATKLGIAVIYQEPSVFPDLDVGENIFIGRQPLTRGLPRIDRSRMHRDAARLLDRLGSRLDPRAPVRGLSVADLQVVEMAAAVSRDARILFIDEPTASLTPAEAEDLFRILRELRRTGTSIGFISHRLEEVFALADRLSVLRDGRVVSTGPVSEFDEDRVVREMVGRQLDVLFQRTTGDAGESVLRVDELSSDGVFANISFEVRSGEIVGMAGLVGAGRSEIARAIFGIDRTDGGHLFLNGRELRFSSPAEAVHAGVAYVPEDRQQHGLVLPMSISENITLPSLARFASAGWLRRSQERKTAESWSGRLRVRSRDAGQRVSELSGGNQQKAVLGKWLETKPRLLILDEPTRGVDVGAKVEIHRLMDELAGEGMAILMISSELPEVLAMSDRVLVIRDGKLAATLERGEATAETVMAAAIGSGRALKDG